MSKKNRRLAKRLRKLATLVEKVDSPLKKLHAKADGGSKSPDKKSKDRP